MKDKILNILLGMIFGLILLLIILLSSGVFNTDKGEYDYCIEWQGFNDGTLHRDSLLFTCYSLATNTFYCDYDIDKQTQVLMIKSIKNTTIEDGVITKIIYDEPNYFNCTRWLKSR